jgi:DNA-binding MarR family transcriptional regulator
MDRITAEMGWVTHRQQTQRLKAFDLTVPQYMTLRAIQAYGRSCTMSELAEAAFQVSATITGIVDRLEERGVVARQPNPADRRSFRVSLTVAGMTLLANIAQQKRQLLQEYLAAVPAAKRRELLQMLRDYLQLMTAELNQ